MNRCLGGSWREQNKPALPLLAGLFFGRKKATRRRERQHVGMESGSL